MISVARLMNPQALTNLYGRLPSFEGAELMEIKFGTNGPAVDVRLMLSKKPTGKPANWPEKYDVVYIELSYGAVKDLNFSQWSVTNIIKRTDCVSRKDKEQLSVLFDNDCRLEFSYDWARVEGVTYGFIGSV